MRRHKPWDNNLAPLASMHKSSLQRRTHNQRAHGVDVHPVRDALLVDVEALCGPAPHHKGKGEDCTPQQFILTTGP